jgi:hypothetical protein
MLHPCTWQYKLSVLQLIMFSVYTLSIPSATFLYFSFHYLAVNLNTYKLKFLILKHTICRSQWPRGLRRRSTAARLLRLWVRIPPGAWMYVCCDFCVLSGRGLCDGLITRPEESYQLWCVVERDLETSWVRIPWPTGSVASKKKASNLLS